jgi:hypothetical protein
MNCTVFLAYVQQVLVPARKPGDIVVMDTCLPTRPAFLSFPTRGASASAGLKSHRNFKYISVRSFILNGAPFHLKIQLLVELSTESLTQASRWVAALGDSCGCGFIRRDYASTHRPPWLVGQPMQRSIPPPARAPGG